jgi:cytochrome b6-f complex iron-sulfur subunit
MEGSTGGLAPCVSSSVVGRRRRPIRGKEGALDEHKKIPRKDFIRLGAAVGLGGAGSSVLVACGGGGGSAQDGGKQTKEEEQAAGGATTSPSVGAGDPIVEAAFIPAGFAFSFNLAESGKPAVLVHLQDESWAAYETVCTHMGCEVGYQLESARLGCPCHGSVFNPAQGGAVVQGPAQEPLQEIKVDTKDGKVVRA